MFVGRGEDGVPDYVNTKAFFFNKKPNPKPSVPNHITRFWDLYFPLPAKGGQNLHRRYWQDSHYILIKLHWHLKLVCMV